MTKIDVTHAMIKAALGSRAADDEGDFPSLFDLMDFSGENKAQTAVRVALEAALNAQVAEPAPANPVAWRTPQPSETHPWGFAWEQYQLDAWREALGIEGEPLYTHPSSKRIQREYDLAFREACDLATWLWKTHYKDDAPKWDLCDTAAGVISQIDNMVTGLEKKCPKITVKDLNQHFLGQVRMLTMGEMVLTCALRDLYDVCVAADEVGELYETIGGDKLDAARLALKGKTPDGRQVNPLSPFANEPTALSEDQYDGVCEMIRQAFIQGCMDVHESYHEDADPDFTEAAYDYTASVTDVFLALFAQNAKNPTCAENAQIQPSISEKWVAGQNTHRLLKLDGKLIADVYCERPGDYRASVFRPYHQGVELVERKEFCDWEKAKAWSEETARRYIRSYIEGVQANIAQMQNFLQKPSTFTKGNQ